MNSTDISAVPLTMSTLEIAGLTGKRHDHVLRDADKMLAELGGTDPKFGASYKDSTGRALRLLNLPKRECLILVSGYSVEMRARIIDRWMELEAAAAQPAPAVLDETRIAKIAADAAVAVVSSILPEMVRNAFAARGVSIRRGKTAGQLWRQFGFPSMRGSAQWFGNRLAELHCFDDDVERGELGVSTARLFDPDKALRWLNNGGRLAVDRYIAERRGQNVLPFKVAK